MFVSKDTITADIVIGSGIVDDSSHLRGGEHFESMTSADTGVAVVYESYTLSPKRLVMMHRRGLRTACFVISMDASVAQKVLRCSGTA